MAELVYAGDLKSFAKRLAGSNPVTGTPKSTNIERPSVTTMEHGEYYTIAQIKQHNNKFHWDQTKNRLKATDGTSIRVFRPALCHLEKPNTYFRLLRQEFIDPDTLDIEALLQATNA